MTFDDIDIWSRSLRSSMREMKLQYWRMADKHAPPIASQSQLSIMMFHRTKLRGKSEHLNNETMQNDKKLKED